jgi:hypothetical protein
LAQDLPEILPTIEQNSKEASPQSHGVSFSSARVKLRLAPVISGWVVYAPWSE